jgi:hypothetical protein
MHEGVVAGPCVQCLLQGIEGQVAAQRARYTPADDGGREHVDDEGDVDEARPGGLVRQVGHPELVGAVGVELTLDQVRRAHGLLGGHGGDLEGSPSDRAAQTHRAHQPRDGATCDRDGLATKLTPDLLGAVDAVVAGVVHAADLASELLITSSASRPPRWIAAASVVLVVGRRGDRQHVADRLDPVLGTGSLPTPHPAARAGHTRTHCKGGASRPRRAGSTSRHLRTGRKGTSSMTYPSDTGGSPRYRGRRLRRRQHRSRRFLRHSPRQQGPVPLLLRLRRTRPLAGGCLLDSPTS